MTYLEKSHQLASESSVAVLVLMGAPDDVEFVPLKPRAADENMLADLKARWPGRGLRSIGMVGLVGVTPRAVLKEPLEPQQVDAMATAFLTYLHVLLSPRRIEVQTHTDDATERMRQAEIDFLNKVFSLPDTRPN
jgi:hypothetical protein